MNRTLLLRLHGWVSLVFALLLLVVGTGLILSFEPIAHHAAVRRGSLTAAHALSLLAPHAPQAQARAVNLRPYDNLLVLIGARPGPAVAIDLSTGGDVQAEGGMIYRTCS